MFRFFLFLFLFYLIYRAFIPSRPRSKKENFRSKQQAKTRSVDYSSEQRMIVDEMKKCPSCGTFNPKSHALEYRGYYYCDEKCRKES